MRRKRRRRGETNEFKVEVPMRSILEYNRRKLLFVREERIEIRVRGCGGGVAVGNY